MSRVVFYYQTFQGLDIMQLQDVTHIHLSSIHFGVEQDGQPYIHLNNTYPDDPTFNNVWSDVEQAQHQGVEIILMIGGAGGGYSTLFQYYKTCYGLLRELLKSKPYITGIDLDIEEQVELADIQQFMRDIKRDFPNFTIAMAPLQYSLQSDSSGMGGFVYKDLYQSPEGEYITYFNGQFYNDFSEAAYTDVINNGYPPDKVVMGSLNGEGSIDVVQNLSKLYSDFGGVFSWEYFNTVPDPTSWSVAMKQAQKPSLLSSISLWCKMCVQYLC